MLRYLQRTKDYNLVLRRSNNLKLEGFAYADFVGYKDNLKSTSRYVFIFACAAVSWRSIKQLLTVASTMLAEFFASYEAISQAMWLKNFITRLSVAKGTKGQMLLEKIRDGYTGSEHINTTDMTADPLTKGLAVKPAIDVAAMVQYIHGICSILTRHWQSFRGL
ncbi:unnamed protein product [Prunus armeniaca]